jgi:hypothetical protein
LKLKIRTAFPPSSVTLFPPSMTVFLFVGMFSVALIGMVTAPLPQLKVITPPVATAAWSWLNVQLAGVPLPTTVGLDVSAGCPVAGTPVLQEPLGFPACPMVPPSDVVVAASPGV